MIAGLDFSITCPSLCIYSQDLDFKYENVIFYFNQFRPAKKEIQRWNTTKLSNIVPNAQKEFSTDFDRYYYLADWILSLCHLHDVKEVIIEGYALGAKGKVFNIAEATSLVKFFLLMADINIKMLPPTVNKKIFTGKGNANKEKMINAFNNMNKIDISEIFFSKKELTCSPVSDIVDSYSLIYSYLQGAQVELW